MNRQATRPRLQAVITGKATDARVIGAEEAHARNVLAITRKIHTKTDRLRRLEAERKRIRQELRGDRAELRAVLQRDSTIAIEGDPRIELAGKADAIDAEHHRQEGRRS